MHIGEGGVPGVQVAVTNRAVDQSWSGFLAFHSVFPGGGRFRPTAVRLFQPRDFDADARLAIVVRDRFGPGGKGVAASTFDEGEIAAILIVFSGSFSDRAAPLSKCFP